MKVEMRHLEMIQAIHEEGTLTGAAARLFLSQPALSRQIAKVEQRLGARLFRRHASGMTLTAEGQRVLRSAEKVLAEVARAEEDVRLMAEGQLGTVRLTTECFMCYHWLPGIARAFGQHHPGIEVQLVPECTRDPYGALESSAAEVALVYTAPPVAEAVDRVALFDDEIVALVASSHPTAERPCLTPEDFDSETLLCHYAEPGRGVLEREFLEPAGIRPGRTMEMLVTPAVVEMARAGFGVAVVPRWILTSVASLEDLRVLPLGAGGLWRTWSAAWQRIRSDERPIRALVQVLGQELNQGAAPRVRSMS